MSAKKPSVSGVQKFPAPKVAIGLESSHLGYVEEKTLMETSRAAAKDVAAKTSDRPHEPKDSVVVGQPATHASGPLHCTGEATYADDIPAPENLLHGSLILASKCNAPLASIDISPALQIAGVVAAFTHEDIVKLGGDNRMGPILLDDFAFLPVGEKVEFVGQVLGIVVAVSQEIAEKGARAIAVNYGDEEEEKAVVSIEDAIRVGSFWNDFRHEMKRGENVKEILKQIEVDGRRLVIVEGSFRSGGQEHFCEELLLDSFIFLFYS